MFTTRVEGAHQLMALPKAMRGHANKETLRSELGKGITKATKPLKKAAKQEARTSLPRQGGANDHVARATLRTKRRTVGQGAGVRIIATPNAEGKVHDLRATNRGVLRHPLFGDRRFWYTTNVRPGWFSRPMEAGAPDVRRELIELMDRIANKIVNDV